jgi:two-component system nitrogen regulation response regulator GlnG
MWPSVTAAISSGIGREIQLASPWNFPVNTWSCNVPNVLVVDDEPSIGWGITRLGESLGHHVVAAASAEQGLAEAERQLPDAIILDVRLPGMDGLSAIERFQALCGNVPIIVITAHGDLPSAVAAVRRGAFDYIAKPFDAEKIRTALVRALDSRPAIEPLGATASSNVEGMIGRSPAMQEVFKQIALLAACDAPVLVAGESGTGKELAARAIHHYSHRANGPFVAVNVASLSPALAESELFGHVRGAFTGADSTRIGLLAQADGGTLFLDEVADIPLPAQVKLLRALEHGQVLPVGGREPVQSNFRVVSATHQSLDQRMKEGTFRHDLYFRLCAFQISLPPLRQRGDDIAELAAHFVAASSGSEPARIDAEAMAELERRPWHGNVRELRNAVEHALILARGRTITRDHLPPPVDLVTRGAPPDDHSARVTAAVHNWATHGLEDRELAGRVYQQLLDVIEPPLLEAALEKHRGQCATAARQLGIHRTTLRKLLSEHGLDTQKQD